MDLLYRLIAEKGNRDIKRKRKKRIISNHFDRLFFAVLNWRAFLIAHIRSKYAMGFFTIDTILNKRYYVFLIVRQLSFYYQTDL